MHTNFPPQFPHLKKCGDRKSHLVKAVKCSQRLANCGGTLPKTCASKEPCCALWGWNTHMGLFRTLAWDTWETRMELSQKSEHNVGVWQDRDNIIVIVLSQCHRYAMYHCSITGCINCVSALLKGCDTDYTRKSCVCPRAEPQFHQIFHTFFGEFSSSKD